MFEQILPEITKKWGAKRFDIMMSLSHNLLKTYLDGAKMTGFNIDKNGNFRFNFNIHFQIIVDKTGQKFWVSSRDIYLGL